MEQDLSNIEKTFKDIVDRRRNAEKALEQLVLRKEQLRLQRDMLYNILLILGADMARQTERITNKFAKLITLRSDLKADITTTTLVEIHKNTLLHQVDQYMEEISKAFDENEIDKAMAHMKNMVAMLKTAMG